MMAKRIELGRVEYVRRSERLIAVRFLNRAMREADRYWAKRFTGSRLERIGAVHRAALWRVVVAASHKSGTFEPRRTTPRKAGRHARS